MKKTLITLAALAMASVARASVDNGLPEFSLAGSEVKSQDLTASTRAMAVRTAS